MSYRAELDFFRRMLRKMRIQTTILRSDELPEEALDFGLRKFLGFDKEYWDAVSNPLLQVEETVVYKLTDSYSCSYIFFALPETGRETVLLIGPYLSFPMSRQRILETAEHFELTVVQSRHLEDYYANISVVPDDSPMYVMLHTFAEHLWGAGNAYKILDLNQNMITAQVALRTPEYDKAKEDTLLQMKLMEVRYAYENELMDTISKGLTHRAEQMLLRAARTIPGQHVPDPLRNLKNHSIICNTLMRKAAERGGVHPIHLDRVSSGFAGRIETEVSPEACQELMLEMARTYCLLVRNSATNRYSPLIQKVAAYIEADLSEDLSLGTLADAHNINASYLSDLFRKDTGRTVTEYVARKRMELGAHLLHTTSLQIQTIAQHCGIPDANYFSKLFRKQFGMTPRQFREITELPGQNKP